MISELTWIKKTRNEWRAWE